jgi:acyl-CoA dehydrogenase
MTTAAVNSYEIAPELEDLRLVIRQIAQARIAPRAAESDCTGEYPSDIRELLAENDIFALPFSEQYGGTGTGTLMLQIAVEEIAKADASCALMLMVQELGTLPIVLFGTDELKQRILPVARPGSGSRHLRSRRPRPVRTRPPCAPRRSKTAMGG